MRVTAISIAVLALGVTAVLGLQARETFRLLDTTADAFHPAKYLGRFDRASHAGLKDRRVVMAADNCTDAQFAADLNAANTACTSITSVNTTGTLLDTIRSAFDSTCQSTCVSLASNLGTRWRSCLSEASLATIAYISVGCERDERNQFCAVVMTDAALSSCGGRSLATCGAPLRCTFRGSSCIQNLTSSYLDSVCTSCTQKIINRLSNYSTTTTNFLVEAARQLQLTTCSRVDSTYCVPELQEGIAEAVQNDGYLTSETQGRVCDSSMRTRCLNKISEGVASWQRASAAAAFTSCARLFSTDALIATNCVSAYVNVWKETEKDSRERRNMCVRNGNGTYCLSYMPAVKATCVTSGLCTPSCSASTTALVNAMQCCVGTLEEVSGAEASFPTNMLASYDRPNVAFTAAATLAPPATLSARPTNSSLGDIRASGNAWLFLSVQASLCTPANLSTYIWVKCPTSMPDAVSKTFPVRLIWSTVAASATLRASLVASISADVARVIGVTQQSIINATLVEDSSVRITPRTSTTMVNGCRFEFKLQGQTAALTNDAAATFDSNSAERQIALTSTTVLVVRACESTCVGEGGVAELNPEASSASSGVAAVTASLSLLAAFLTLLL